LGEVAIYSDNKDSLCKNVVDLKKVSFPRVFRPNVDLKLQIDQMRSSIRPLDIVPIHIKGHQDDDKNFELDKAPLSVQCNIKMDEKAKAFLQSHQGRFEPNEKAKEMPVMQSWLKINSSTIHNNFAHHIKLNYESDSYFLNENHYSNIGIQNTNIVKIIKSNVEKRNIDGTEPFILYISFSSDDFEHNQHRKTKGSMWLKTVTICPPSTMPTSSIYTYILSLSKKGKDHDVVHHIHCILLYWPFLHF